MFSIDLKFVLYKRLERLKRVFFLDSGFSEECSRDFWTSYGFGIVLKKSCGSIERL